MAGSTQVANQISSCTTHHVPVPEEALLPTSAGSGGPLAQPPLSAAGRKGLETAPRCSRLCSRPYVCLKPARTCVAIGSGGCCSPASFSLTADILETAVHECSISADIHSTYMQLVRKRGTPTPHFTCRLLMNPLSHMLHPANPLWF